jgi:hypothetical protein
VGGDILPNRFIKESVCTSETLDHLTAEEERLFYRLIVTCDDYGRFDARPEIVRSRCFPWKVDKLKIYVVGDWISRLAVVELITLYENYGKPYLQFNTWTEHQQIRATKSKYPGPGDEGSNVITTDINSYLLITVPANVDRTRIRISNTNNVFKEKGGMGEKGKNSYAEFVFMTDGEYQKLIEKYGAEDTQLMIDKLDNAKGSKGYKYKSDYRAILNWVAADVLKNKVQQKQKSPGANFEQRKDIKYEYDL